MARQGLTVEREVRQISIDSLELLRFEPERLELRALCSKGTYIRVLAGGSAGTRDLRPASCGANMSNPLPAKP